MDLSLHFPVTFKLADSSNRYASSLCLYEARLHEFRLSEIACDLTYLITLSLAYDEVQIEVESLTLFIIQPFKTTGPFRPAATVAGFLIGIFKNLKGMD